MLEQRLAEAGPEGMIAIMAMLGRQLGARAREQGDVAAADRWETSSEAIGELAESLRSTQDITEDDQEDAADDAEPEEELADVEEEMEDEEKAETRALPTKARESVAPAADVEAAPGAPPIGEVSKVAAKPKERRTKLVAGQFQVSARVATCRLRRVTEAGDRLDLVGRANERGFEETEWRVEQLTAERMRSWFGPGRYSFEWYANDGKSGRVPLGRSQAFRIFDTTKKADGPAPAPAAPPALALPAAALAGASFDQGLALLRFVDETRDRERQREWEERRLREELASKERIAQLEAQAKVAELSARARDEDEDNDGFDEEALLSRIEEMIDAKLSGVSGGGDDGLPSWMRTLGVNKEMIGALLQNVPSMLAKIQPPPAPAPQFIPNGAGESGGE